MCSNDCLRTAQVHAGGPARPAVDGKAALRVTRPAAQVHYGCWAQGVVHALPSHHACTSPCSEHSALACLRDPDGWCDELGKDWIGKGRCANLLHPAAPGPSA